jgi:hypothetical protein
MAITSPSIFSWRWFYTFFPLPTLFSAVGPRRDFVSIRCCLSSSPGLRSCRQSASCRCWSISRRRLLAEFRRLAGAPPVAVGRLLPALACSRSPVSVCLDRIIVTTVWFYSDRIGGTLLGSIQFSAAFAWLSLVSLFGSAQVLRSVGLSCASRLGSDVW